jgi:hypothetical protein
MTDMKPRTATNQVRYARIEFRPGFEFRVPGRTTGHSDLFDVDGIPHSGGVDVILDGEDFNELKQPVKIGGQLYEAPIRITVPWQHIKQTYRAVQA